MFEIQCPECKVIRIVSARKPWMNGDQPFIKLCRSCCQIGKIKTKECRAKLSIAMAKLQTEEVLQRKSDYANEHPEIWQQNLIAGKGGGWNKGLQTQPRSDETKRKISESMKGKTNEQK